MTVASQDGLLALRLRRDTRGRTVIAARRQRFPLRMTVPMYLDDAERGMAFVYAQNPSGAVHAGDRLRTHVVAEPGSQVHVTTQSATKLAGMRGGRATADLHFLVGAGAYLEHVPDPLIPQAGADYRQSVVVDVAEGGTYVGAEILAPGRLAHGERFGYDHVRLTTEIRRGERELAVDVLDLEPRRRCPRRHGLLGAQDYVVSLIVAAPEHDAGELVGRLDALLAAAPDGVGAAGALPNDAGVGARALTAGPIAARRLLRQAWTLARSELLGAAPPAARQ